MGRPPADHITRIQTIADLLACGLLESKVIRQCADKWGLSTKTVRRYIGRARAMLRSQMDKNIKDHLAESYRFVQRIKNDPLSSPRVKLLAQERLDKLLGLERPQIIHHDIKLEDTRKQIEVLTEDSTSLDLVLQLADRQNALERINAEN